MTQSQLIEIIEAADGDGLIIVEPDAAGRLAINILQALDEPRRHCEDCTAWQATPENGWDPGEIEERLEHTRDKEC